MIKAFFFDYHGVIAKDGSAKKSLLLSSKVPLTKEEINPRWSKAKIGSKNQLKEYCVGLTTEKEFLNTFKNETIFWDKEVFVLDLLKNKYKLAVLSNHIPQIIDYILRELDIKSYFDEVIVSSNGLQKPDVLFFELALNRLKVKPSESVFVDDKLENIRAAKQMGFITIWLNNPITAKNNPPEMVKSIIPNFTITEFEELISIEKQLQP